MSAHVQGRHGTLGCVRRWIEVVDSIQGNFVFKHKIFEREFPGVFPRSDGLFVAAFCETFGKPFSRQANKFRD